VVGAEQCRHCGFVPIGAGLQGLYRDAQKEQKQRQLNLDLSFGLERQPGSRNGLIVTALFVILLGLSYDQKIWANNWEFVRAIMGAPRSVSLVGDWGITETKELDAAGMAHRIDGLYGTIQFGQNGTVRLSMTRGTQSMDATGLYLQNGNEVLLKQLTGTNGSSPLPAEVRLTLLYRKSDTMKINVEKEEQLTLVRIEPDKDSKP
jgi:hypothetical protein